MFMDHSWWMRIVEEKWKVRVVVSRRMAANGMAVGCGRAIAEISLARGAVGMLMLHVARGYSLRETVVRAKLANWPDISDV